MSQYEIGTAVMFQVVFKTGSGALTDPSSVFFNFKLEGGDVRSYGYGPDVEVTKTATGTYEYTFVGSVSGDYIYRIAGTGSLFSATEGRFRLSGSEVV